MEELVGNRLVFGIPGARITPDIIQHFKDTHCGGLILYRINFESPDQTRKLISDWKTPWSGDCWFAWTMKAAGWSCSGRA